MNVDAVSNESATDRGWATGPAPTADEVVAAAYLERREPIRRWLVARARDEELAEELTQEALVRLLHVLRAGTEVANLRAWLFQVAENLLVSQVRRGRVASRYLALQRDGFEPVSAEAIVVHQERLDDLGLALGRLSSGDRRLLLLAGAGDTGPHMAEAAGISAAALRTRLCRARRRLRDEIGLAGRPRPLPA